MIARHISYLEISVPVTPQLRKIAFEERRGETNYCNEADFCLDF
jgi:hypothetical protein